MDFSHNAIKTIKFSLFFIKRKESRKEIVTHHGTPNKNDVRDVKNDCVRTNGIVHVKVKSSNG